MAVKYQGESFSGRSVKVYVPKTERGNYDQMVRVMVRDSS